MANDAEISLSLGIAILQWLEGGFNSPAPPTRS